MSGPGVLVAALLSVMLAAGSLAVHPEPSTALDSAFEAFWDAGNPGAAERAAKKILSTGAAFEVVLERLRKGRPYTRARTGRIELPWAYLETTLDNAVEVPADYDPARAWPVRVSLHGGVDREAPAPDGPAPRPLTHRASLPGEIVIIPRAWSTSTWWTATQVDNIARLLDLVKRRYNVDESRVYITGFSDGGTGVFFFAMREATPWAACVPLHGQPLVLANPRTRVEGALFPGNAANCPLRIVNGGRDPLYPAAEMAPFVEMFREAGGVVDFQVYPDAAHDMSWWPQDQPRLRAFLDAHPRESHPDRISWETDRTDRFQRFRWLVIEKLGARRSDQALEDINTVATDRGTRQLFGRFRRSGRVDAIKRGNRLELRTRGVEELTLLVPADGSVDFTKAIVVTVNGQTVHDGIVRQDSSVLLKWGARDNDRTMLYAAALRVQVP